jgi:hypothetical protein
MKFKNKSAILKSIFFATVFSTSSFALPVKIRILGDTSSNRFLDIEIDKNTTIENLKELIEQKTGIKKDIQIIIKNGEPTEDNQNVFNMTNNFRSSLFHLSRTER